MTAHIDFGYDSEDQMYFEISESTTLVMNFENKETSVKVFKNGEEIEASSLKDDELHKVDLIVKKHSFQSA